MSENKELMPEWDWEANEGLNPNKITCGSHIKAWWKCSKCGYKWQTIIQSRALGHRGCPACANKVCVQGINDLATTHPDIAKEWHPTKNGDLKPTDVVFGSTKKVWWKCSKCGYEWQTIIASRSLYHQGCPACVNKVCISGKNDLSTIYPELVREWHPTKNGNLKPTDVVAGSHKKVWWQCQKCGGEWQATIYERAKGAGCSYCIGHKVLQGFNDLATIYPELAREWHPTKNGNLRPTDVTIASGKKVWWECSRCGYVWQATVALRGWSHQGCPACSNQVCVVGKNDLATTHPDIAKEWHPTKNGNLKPTDVVAGSGKKVWWQCLKCGREWQAVVYSRGLGKHGCPVCAKIQGGKKLTKLHVKKYGSLAETHPELAKEWNPTENGKLTPYDITANSPRKVWWKCPFGHAYQASISNRVHAQTNCPICNLRNSTSFPEQAIFYYIKKLYPNSMNKYKECFKAKMEFDIYIPELKIAIEYDGAQWHKTDSQHKKEIRKYNFCKENKIYLIRIKEHRDKSWKDSADKIYNIPVIDKKDFQALEQIIRQLFETIGNQEQLHFEINIEKDKNEILKYLSKIENSLAEKRPDVAAKWNYEKNGNLTPDMFSVSANDVMEWRCPDCGKEWRTRISTMTQEKYGCPECSKIKKGKTIREFYVKKSGSLADKMPELAKEWHSTENGNLKPTDVTVGSGRKVLWQCSKCGHKWKATVASRGLCHQGCPVCANQVCIAGKNDLATTHPDLAKEWHPTKNGDLKPTDVVAGSKKKVWWRCPKCGHEYKMLVLSRGGRNRGCPECSKIQKGQARVKLLIQQQGSLADKMPELVKEWHPTKNGELTPCDITAGSHTKVWWQCPECGEEWQAVIRERAKGFCKCPHCAKKKTKQLEFDFS